MPWAGRLFAIGNTRYAGWVDASPRRPEEEAPGPSIGGWADSPRAYGSAARRYRSCVRMA